MQNKLTNQVSKVLAVSLMQIPHVKTLRTKIFANQNLYTAVPAKCRIKKNETLDWDHNQDNENTDNNCTKSEPSAITEFAL